VELPSPVAPFASPATTPFAELGVERMELYLEPDNLASRGVARKAGFVEEGVPRKQAKFGEERRDMLICSRLPSG